MRERGLKRGVRPTSRALGRVAPRAGAWIEAAYAVNQSNMLVVAPRAGAWIEARLVCTRSSHSRVAPRAGAWIEARSRSRVLLGFQSLPVRERGLKLVAVQVKGAWVMSLPVRERGLKPFNSCNKIKGMGVAPRAGAWIEAPTISATRAAQPVAPRAGAWIEATPGRRMP